MRNAGSAFLTKRAWVTAGLALLLILELICAPLAHALSPGDIVVVDGSAGTNGQGALFRVDPATGTRTLLSDFGVGPNQGVAPARVAVEASGQILVVDLDAGTNGHGALFRVDPTTGARTLLNDFGVGPNQGSYPVDVTVEASGQILVVDKDAGTNSQGALFRVDPVTGVRTLVSDFGVGSNQGREPHGVAVAFGEILVIDVYPVPFGLGNGVLFRVDPTTGARTILSDFNNNTQGGTGISPVGVAVEASGQILVVDQIRGLFRVDPLTGVRTFFSDFSSGSNPGVRPIDVAVEASGQILVVDYSAGTNGQGALFRVDPITGARTILSDFGVGSNLGVDPAGVDVVPQPPAACTPPAFLVIDPSAGTSALGALFRVDPNTGARTLVSDFNSPNSHAADPGDVAIEASGQILVVDPSGGTRGANSGGALFRVEPTTGARTLLSDFGVGDNKGFTPQGVAVEASGQILVVDFNAGTNQRGALFRVDPTTGARTLLSDFGVGSNQGLQPAGVAVEASGQILVVDLDAGTDARGALFRVDAVTGARALVSDFGVGSPLGLDPAGVAVEASGQILVIDPNAGTNGQGALFRVDPTTGARTVLSDFGVGSNPGSDPLGVAIEASGFILVTDQDAGTGGRGALFRVHPATGARMLVNDFGIGNAQGADPFRVAVAPGDCPSVGPFLTVTKGGTGSGTVTSNPPGINCGVDCSEQYPSATPVTLTATPAPGSVFMGWLGACIGTGPCNVNLGAATDVSATFAPDTIVPGIDIDGNGNYDALTDGLLIIRYLSGLTGSSLTSNAIGVGPTRTTPVEIAQFMDNIGPLLDVDGNGQADAPTDGLLVIRYLFGVRGPSVITGAIGVGATRTSAPDIEAYIQSLMPQ